MIEIMIGFIIWGFVCYRIGLNKGILACNIMWANAFKNSGFTEKQALEVLHETFQKHYEVKIKEFDKFSA